MNILSTVIADSAQQAGGMFGGNSMWVMILIYGAIIAGVYFFLIRPNSKKKKEEAQMRNSLEIGDEITTIGGIMGRIVAIKDDEDGAKILKKIRKEAADGDEDAKAILQLLSL